MSKIFWLPLCISPLLLAQLNSGTIVGVVVDSSGANILGAQITLTSETTGDARKTLSSSTGNFTLPGVPAGSYTLRISFQGFQSIERKAITVTSNEYLPAGTFTLQPGSTTEVINVTAGRAVVQTASAENSALLDSKQMSTLLTRGRDVMSLLRLMPGVSQNSDPNSLGSEIGSSAPNIGGLRSTDSTVSVDGMVSSDSDNVNVSITAVSMDAVEEVKVLVNNFQAEYGRNAGAQVSIISKSGTREFHGSASWFKRHEMFNANNFFSNLNGISKPVYRYNTFTATLGGPVSIPKLFNKNRDKLFFFYAREQWLVREPQGLQQTTMPTALERAGNFSQTTNQNGSLIVVRDPNNQLPFPGNVIPSNRLNPFGQAMLNIFPQPTFLDRNVSRGAYNYQFQDIRDLPKRLDQIKVDYNATSKDRLSFRYRDWKQSSTGFTAIAGWSSNWDHYNNTYSKIEKSALMNYTRTVTPNIINEFVVGGRIILEGAPKPSTEQAAPVLRSTKGLAGLRQLYPEANPDKYLPVLSFGGVVGAPTVGYDNRWPINAGDTRWSIANNVTWTRGQHSLKAGGYYEFNLSDEGISANCFTGCYDFTADSNNPRDSGYAFSNAALGNFRSYSESSKRNFRGGQNYTAEFFVQDSWKVSRRLTFELGLRLSLFSPWTLQPGQEGAAWVKERFDPSKAVRLFRPALDAANRRVGQNPVTGQIVPAVLIGAIVPGIGDPFNGMVLGTDKGVPPGWQNRPPLQPGPRFGFAYDVFGNGKTAIRGGFGITRQTQINSAYANSQVNAAPPIVLQPSIFYDSIESVFGSAASSSAGFLFPVGAVRTFERDYKPASVYNYSLNIQQNVGFDTVVSVAYVGNVGRNLNQNRNLNTLPYGTRFLASSLDATSPGRPLPDTFLAPYTGFQTISALENSGTSNYNSLQTTANRRFSRGLQFGAAWTYSKAMNLSDTPANMPLYRSAREFLYGKAGYDQTHILVVNFTYDVPKLTQLLPSNPATRLVLDGWQVAGFTSMASGFPTGVGFSTVDNADITGGGDGNRINVRGPAALPSGEQTFARWFNPTVFSRPARGDFGNAPKDVFRGPGINAWDVSVFKNFPLRSENRLIQFRGEFYNMFNHTQFSGLDTTARFDAAGNQVNTRFGQLTGARSPRIIQFAVSFKF